VIDFAGSGDRFWLTACPIQIRAGHATVDVGSACGAVSPASGIFDDLSLLGRLSVI
jgi:hypothetical protein